MIKDQIYKKTIFLPNAFARSSRNVFAILIDNKSLMRPWLYNR